MDFLRLALLARAVVYRTNPLIRPFYRLQFGWVMVDYLAANTHH